MDELCALEREEALRRAEYEARHAEALRRAELVSRHVQDTIERQPLSQRLSKSATTSPVMRDQLTLTLADERSPVAMLDDNNNWYSPPMSPTISNRAADLDDKSSQPRRLSGPAWPDEQLLRRPSICQSRSSGHLVETLRHTSLHNISWSHPYHQYQQYRHPGEGLERRGKHPYDELPSPISSDGEHPDRIESPNRIFPSAYGHTSEHSPPHYSSSVRTTSATEVGCTPSTSPFLGPLRTLNIHSANPSRAPSPILLPPPATTRGYDFRDTPYSDDSMTPSRAGSIYGSPPSAGLNPRSGKTQQVQPAARKSDGLFTFQSTYAPSATSSQIHTPLLTSGASSNGSSPGSLGHFPSPTALTGLYRDPLNGASIASGSRPSSPHQYRGSPPSTHTTSRHHHPGGNQSPHHLAQSVRVAFGMTPIHSHPPSRRSSPPPPPSLPRNTSWSAPSELSHQPNPFSHRQPTSGRTTPFTFGTPHGAFGTRSIPASRAPSPPIRLPALKTLSGNKNPDEDAADMDSETKCATEKIELPHFSEFEASTRIPLSEPIRSEVKMSIDFVKS